MVVMNRLIVITRALSHLLFCLAAIGCPIANASERELAERLERVEQAYQQQRFQDAIDELRELVLVRRHEARLWLRLGNCLEQAGDLAQALDAYQSAARIPLPTSHTFGFLEARQLRGKALLNTARIGLIQVRQVLDDYGQSGAAQHQFGELTHSTHATEQRLRRLLDENRLTASARGPIAP
jgi:tetratricopeptide (TPR) repeat protein